MHDYSDEELSAIYELGRLYFEMGYFAPAERVFNGLSAVDNGSTPARLGVGLVKLETGLYQEAAAHFRVCLQNDICPSSSKLALCATYIAVREISRARSILSEIRKSGELSAASPDVKRFYEALTIRCSE